MDVNNVNVEHQCENVEQMHHASEDVMSSSILVPLELDELLDSLGLVNDELLGFIEESHEIDVRVQVSFFATVLLVCVDDVLSNDWKQVDGVFDLVNFTCVDGANLDFFLSILGHIIDGSELFLMEHNLVVLSNVENRVVIWSQMSVIVSVGTWPFIIIELQTEYIAVKKWENIDCLFEEHWEVLQEKIT